MNAHFNRGDTFQTEDAGLKEEVYKAVTEVYRSGRVSESFFRYITAMGGDAETARDIFQDAVLTVMEKRSSRFQFKGDAAFHKYLFTTCVRQWQQYRMRDRRYRNCLLQYDQPEVDKDDPLSLLIESEQRGLAEECLRLVGGRCRRLIELWMHDFGMDEIALIERISSARLARKYKYRCLNRLKKCLVEKKRNCQGIEH